jgi:hypothetical protein
LDRPVPRRRAYFRGFRVLLKRHLALATAPVVLLAGGAAFSTPIQAEAKVFPTADVIRVEGPIGTLSTTGLTLTPAFAPKITDYVLRCQSGVNSVTVTLGAASGGSLNVLGQVAGRLVIQESLVENQALVLDWHGPKNPAGTQYWIRCLPHDFPQLAVSKTGNPYPGWYLTGNISSLTGGAAYSMILDTNGTPVWYQRSAGTNSLNLTLLPGGRLAWGLSAGLGFGIDPKAAFEIFNLHTRTATLLRAPIVPTDFHELHPMSNGDLMMLSSPLLSDMDLTPLGFKANSTIVDCVLEEVNPLGQAVWTWRGSEHIAPAESIHPTAAFLNGQLVYDIFHCNSIDTDFMNTAVLLSSRNADAIYLIDKQSGQILWKMGGNTLSHDGAQILTIANDPEGAFHAQHDARFQPGGDISMYDDQSGHAGLAARGVQYHIDLLAGSATLDWSYQSPDGLNSLATGSFRRLNGGADNVIAWGIKPRTLFSEVDASGTPILVMTFPNGEAPYRVQKLPASALDHSLLRATAGLLPTVQ